MSYLVLGLGAFLSLCGTIAIYTGYGIIQVERGWASVIAGSMAFSCGIVTLALGLILHRLSHIHAVLKSSQGIAPPREMAWRTGLETSAGFLSESSIAPESPVAAGTVPPMAAAPGIPPAPAPAPRSWAQRPMRSNLAAARNFLKSRGTVMPAARGISEGDYSPRNGPPLSGNGHKNQPAAGPSFEHGFAIPAEVAVPKPDDAAETRSAFSPAERPWRMDREPNLFEPRQNETNLGETNFDDPSLFDEVAENETEEPPRSRPLETRDDPKQPRGQPGPEINWRAETASIETIIEEELFIELYREPDLRTGDTESLRDTSEPARPDAAPPVEPQTEAGDSPEPPREAPPGITPAGQEELAIVGQYQSGGTSYVMYSDGSIEARTEHAVFHFKSMTELKTFMESEAQKE